jgi:Domain of unknown function (DUF4188)
MWREASANREKYGCKILSGDCFNCEFCSIFADLGKTPTLLATEDENTNTAIWISYWKSLDHLHAFARGDSHHRGWDWYTRGDFKHIGIMHETYVVPAGSWESIYHNFRPFGLGMWLHCK